MIMIRKLKDALNKYMKKNYSPDRRKFGKAAIAGVLGSSVLFSNFAKQAFAYIPGKKKNASKVKLALQVSSQPDYDELTFVKQLGVEYVVTWTGGNTATCENFLRIRNEVESVGLKVWSIGNHNVHCIDTIPLNLPGRDEKVEEYIRYLRNLGKAGIYNTTYGHIANGIWGTGPEKTRGGAVAARSLDLEEARKGKATWFSKSYKDMDTPTHGRVYSEEEMWDNYTYFIKAVAPVAEEAGVRIGIHPDDPPYPMLGGIPRCIFSSFDGYKRALEIANSDNVGMCLCVGCWLEGGTLMGKDVVETIQYFGKRNKIFKVHFRNVDAPLPHYVETFLDDGYMDMYKVMKALREADNNCVVIDDHIPEMVGGKFAAHAFHMGYMRALLERANEELGG